MSADPEILPPYLPLHEQSDEPRTAPSGVPPSFEDSQSGMEIPAGDALLAADLLESSSPMARAPREVPNIGHTLLLFAATAIFWFIAEIACLGIAMMLTPGHQRSHSQALASDPRFLVASEAIGYALTAGFAALVFPVWWGRSFRTGIHWNWPSSQRKVLGLALLGLCVGFSMSLLGSFLPMPKDPPIVKDIMSNTAGAWIMFLFAVTGAPLFEEFVFRGFLLPSLVNLFRWMGRRELLSPAVANAIGIPLSIMLTSLPFALMHATQVSSAWGPLLLIGMVSLVLCAVRISLDSLAASTIVHASYNFTLFAGILVSTGGFRHLDKLSG